MNYRPIVTTLVPLVAFSITLGLLWQGNGPHLQPSSRPRYVESQPQPVTPAPRTPVGAAALRPAPAPVPELAAVASTLAPALSGRGGNLAEETPVVEQVPANFLFQAGSASSPAVAQLLNLQPRDDLPVRVSTENPSNHYRSSVDVTVAAHQRLDLIEAGLSVARGDLVTLHSEGFRDRTLTAH